MLRAMSPGDTERSTLSEAPGVLRARARRARPTRGDAAVALGLLVLLLLGTTPAIDDPGTALGPPPITLDGHWRDQGWAWALQLALVLPLLWRSRAPLPVLLVIAAVGLVQWLTGPELYGDLAVLVAVYTVVAHDPRTPAVAGAVGIAAAGLTLAIVRWVVGTDAGAASAVALGAMVALPIAFGLVVRSRRRAVVATRESAARGERARISREMHDVVAHNLSVMVALADGARMTVARDPAEAERAIAQVARTGRDALDEMRTLLGVVQEHDAGDPLLRPQPGIAQLPEVVDAVRATGLHVGLHVDAGAPLPGGLGLTVHRVVQEALTNVLKHAPEATRADVVVRRTGDDVAVEIRDDGPPVPARRPGDGRGLQGMGERVALHGGRLDAGPAPGGGWHVRTTLHVRGAP